MSVTKLSPHPGQAGHTATKTIAYLKPQGTTLLQTLLRELLTNSLLPRCYWLKRHKPVCMSRDQAVSQAELSLAIVFVHVDARYQKGRPGNCAVEDLMIKIILRMMMVVMVSSLCRHCVIARTWYVRSLSWLVREKLWTIPPVRSCSAFVVKPLWSAS